MLRTYAGEPNTLSSLLFASALVLIGLMLVLFFPLFSTCFPARLFGRNLATAGTVAGVASGISCIGIALTPWDRLLHVHMLFVYCLSLSFLAVALFYSAAILRNPGYPNAFAIVFMAYFAVLLMFVSLMILGPDFESPAGTRILATGQKICIYSGMICIAVQVLGVRLSDRGHPADQAAS
jgi:hypothetical protein